MGLCALALGAGGCGGVEAGSETSFQERAFPGRVGEARRARVRTLSGEREVTYELVDGERVFQGDILLGDEDVGEVREAVVEELAATRTRAKARWPGGVVPYTLDPALPAPQRVLAAMSHWEAHTRLRFVPRTTQADYVTFRSGNGCSSNVGRMGGQQFVTLGSGCTTGNALHEIGHVLGLWHEQARADRDRHVRVHLENVEEGYAYAFDTFVQRGEDGRSAGPYRIDSLMHYASDAFSANGLPTLTLLDGTPFYANREVPTAGDICAVRRLHGFGRHSDLDGDGRAELVIGAPGEDVGTGVDQGAVSIFMGAAGGLGSTGLWLHRDVAGVEDVAADGDRFGAAVAVGDFNGDCLADVAVGVPGDDVNGIVDAGSVHVFPGSFHGVDLAADRVLHQNTPGIPDSAELGDQFGATLAVGDFNGDGYDDLAVGVPFEDYGSSAIDSGLVTVVYGSAAGLTATGARSWSQASAQVLEVTENGDRFGSALAAGDFDGDGFDELAVGVPFEDVGAVPDVGAVNVLRGSIDGLSSAGNQLWSAGGAGVPGSVSEGVRFGSALAAGDFDGDGRSELAIGSPGQTVGVAPRAGAVTVLRGDASGLVSTGAVAWSQDSAGISDVAEVGDGFGSALVVEDFDGDGHADLAVGVPSESVGAVVGAGLVHVLYGAPGGLSGAREQVWSQAGSAVDDGPETLDVFGNCLATGDFDGDGDAELAVGAPYEDLEWVVDSGVVHVLYSAGASGLSRVGEQRVSHAPSGETERGDAVETGDVFGLGL
ncbi:M12 family metallopeptidase [Myxococcus stipitatus]|uniref:M12 family metallopeptidase n=1 Tax=Myxococcus stipitatus TaxID=83455 RepID=UPI001F404EB3|nr:M12 family metallopeptidase [Myxococcus stipitatus]MCE9669109.1 M12 family metallopeptidase [Myxococcus stipitatus]